MGSQSSLNSTQCLVFHDLSVNPVPTLKALLQASSSNPTLKSIFAACERGIRAEYDTLRPQDRQRTPVFRTIRELVRSVETKAIVNTSLNVILQATAQLGCFVRLVEKEPSLLSPNHNHVNYLGLCTGSIAAAMVATVRSFEELSYLSEFVVRVAFRSGLEADHRARSLDRNHGSWAIALPETALQEASAILDDFNRTSNLPAHLVAYVSADLRTSVTISGPPSTLTHLISSVIRPRCITFIELNITAPFHAKHLAPPDVESIVDFLELDAFHLRSNCTVSPSQRAIKSHDTSLRSVLKALISSIFEDCLSLESFHAALQSQPCLQLSRVTSIQPCGSRSSIRKILGLWHDIQYDTAGPELLGSDLSTGHADDDVAVIGMAGRFPDADTLDEFWDIIASGRDVHQPISRRIELQGDRDSTVLRSSACFMKSPGLFDHAFFNLSPREAKQIDPQHRILLMVTQEALQMIGYSGAGNKRIGTFFGQATDDWRESHIRQDIDIFYVGAGMRAFAPGRLNYHYKWEGPSYSVDTACSASLAALELATKAIQSGDCDLAVVGGGNLCSALPMFEGLAKGRFTSKTGSCKTFCATADGYCRGEAVGVVVLQRVGDAVRENTNIHGVVTGITTNHSAWASSITHPHVGAQQSLMLDVLDIAGISPADVDYVELHGTGTQAGDGAEIDAVSRVFDQHGTRSRPLHIGAVKSNVGHCEAAAGIVSLIKALLMLRHDTIPPHCGIKMSINPAVAEVMSPDLRIPDQPLPFKKNDRARTIMINNFNATGGNTSLLLRDAPASRQLRGTDPRLHFPIVLSGQSAASLKANLLQMREYLGNTPSIDIPSLSYSTTARRTHFNHRKALIATDHAQLALAIDEALSDAENASPRSKPDVAFVFAGQGTQKQGIAAELFETSPYFRSTLRGFESLCINMGFPAFVELLTNKGTESKWSAVQSQLSTVAIELALARLWQSWGIKPSFVVGHSIGEYTALCVAGVLSDFDMFALVGKRAQLMEDLCQRGTHSMLSVHLPGAVITALLKELDFPDIEIACYNSHTDVTLGGPREQLQTLRKVLGDRRVKCTALNVEYAFHSRNMEPIQQPYRDFSRSFPCKAPTVPVLSTVRGEKIAKEGVFGADYFVDHAIKPVRFVDALECCNANAQINPRRTLWIEFGAGDPACISFVRSTVESRAQANVLPSLITRHPTWHSISDNISKCFEESLDMDWASYHRDYEQSLRLLDLPKYAFDLQEFWIPLEKNTSSFRDGQNAEVKLDPLLHTLQTYTSSKNESRAEFTASLRDDYLAKTISGHSVMGAPLCPSSIYCIMSLRAASILYAKNNAAAEGAAALAWAASNMNIHQALVARHLDSRSIGVVATQQAGVEAVAVSIVTHKGGKQSQIHGNCDLRVESINAWRLEWSRFEYLLQRRMEQLEKSATKDVMRLTKPVIYKLFSHIVDYSKPFQGIQLILLDTTASEAVAEVRFDESPEAGEDYNIYLMDSLMHFAGFVLNNGIEDDSLAYISNGWECLRVPPGLNPANEYKFYVRLSTDGTNRCYSGDLYVFQEGKIVASCIGVRFSKMRKDSLRRTLNRGLSEPEALARTMPETVPVNRREEHGLPNRFIDGSKQQKLEGFDQRLCCIVSQEAGVPEDRVTGSTGLAELGLDSILMSAIVERIQKELGVELASSQAQGAQNFAELKALAAVKKAASSDAVPQVARSTEVSSQVTVLPKPQDNAETDISCLPQSSDHSSNILSLVSSHTGITEDAIRLNDDFSKLGVDSLLSLEILDAIQETTGIDLPSSFLQQNSTIEAVVSALAALGTNSPASTSISKASTDGDSSLETSAIHTPTFGSTSLNSHHMTPKFEAEIRTLDLEEALNRVPPARVSEPVETHPVRDIVSHTEPQNFISPLRLVHGDPKSPQIPVFLFPSGNGRVAVYNRFPPPASKNPIYCVESPFISSPDDPSHTFDNVAIAYKQAIRRKFPHGPYLLAGYSLGGAYTFEVARQLLAEGATVARLVILDCPVPTPAPADASSRWFGFEALVMTGILDDHYEQYQKAAKAKLPPFPPTMYRHNAAATRAFDRYDPKPFGDNKPQKTVVMWATHGLQEQQPERCVVEQRLLETVPEDERDEFMQMRRQNADREWIYQERFDFDDRGWAKWLGKDIELDVIEGTHINIIMEPRVAELAQKMYAALGL